ncbi:MAG: SpoIIE family protein phosphatase [Solirubrobacterales bacterium]
MLLRTRVTLIVSVTYSLLVAGLMFAGLKSEELADERYAQATLNGQDIFWRKLVENTVQRLETDGRAIADSKELIAAVERRDPTAVLNAVAPLSAAMRARQRVSRFEVISPDGELLFNSRGSLLDPPTLDAGTVKSIAETGKSVRGVQQDSAKVFAATLAFPLENAGRVAGVVVVAADMHPPLEEFKASTGSDIFVVDRNGQLALGTDDGLWTRFGQGISVRRSRLETIESGADYFSVAVLPLWDGSQRVIGALLTARDVTATQTRQHMIRRVSIAAVVGFLLVVLGVFYVYLRKSFGPLNEAIAVLNALSRGDTSVTLEVRNDKDEIGRIAGTVGVFRDNAVKLEMLQERRERQRRRQELFIRLQMQKLSEMLAEEARAAILADLKQMEEMSNRDRHAAEAGKGELEVLGVAFQTMSDRIREQHESLQSLIAERTRDVEILREALRTRDQLAALRQELDFARELQLSSLPQVFPPFPDRTEFQIHAAMVPAKEVGGDFYDFFLIDSHHLGFVIGDASGKGVPAAMFIAITRSLIKAVAPLSGSPGECMAFVNTMLSVDNPQTLFATCFYAVLDTRSGEVAFCNAGHPPPLILRTDGAVDAIRDVSGVALGVMEGLDYETGTFRLQPGDTVLLYTDGVTEAQDLAEKLYDEPRLIEAFGTLGGLEPSQVIAGVQASVETFVDEAPQFDDITMLSLRFDAPSVGEVAEDASAAPRLALTGFKPAVSEAEAPPAAPAPAAVPMPAVASETPAAPATPATPEPPVTKVTITAKPVKPKPDAKPEPKPVRAKVVRVARVEPAAAVAKDAVAADPAPPPPPPAAHNRLEVIIGNDLDELQRLAVLVNEFVERNGLAEKIAFNLNLCLDELITNIVSYGYRDDHRHEIHVRFRLTDGTLMTEIEDDAQEYNPFTEAPEPDLDAGVEERRIGGLGVFLVKEFMDSTEYVHEAGHNFTRLWKRTEEQEN